MSNKRLRTNKLKTYRKEGANQTEAYPAIQKVSMKTKNYSKKAIEMKTTINNINILIETFTKVKLET